MIQGIDISNYYGKPDSSWFYQLGHEEGIRRLTVRASLEDEGKRDIARYQIHTAREMNADIPDFEVDGYVWGYPKAEDAARVADRYMDWYGDLALPAVHMDMEETDPRWVFFDAAANTDWLAACLDRFDRLKQWVGIYTGRWWWTDPKFMANSRQFSDRPLWASQFDLNRQINITPFGGWGDATGKQWCGESQTPQSVVAGVGVDRSTWNPLLLPQGVPVTDDEKQQLLDQIAALEEDRDQLKKKYDDLDSWTSSAINDFLRPGLKSLDQATIMRGTLGWQRVRSFIKGAHDQLEIDPAE